MRKILEIIIVTIICVIGIIMGFMEGIHFNELQLSTLKVLIIIALVACALCFLLGEITRNNSQMDKLWSILPIIYSWVITIYSSFNLRLVIISILITIWGIRLTYNFGLKGAYKLKFWEGEEDYRWKILRSKKPFDNKIIWALFDLFFISFYQNFLVLSICLPMVIMMASNVSINMFDIMAAVLALLFLGIETIADITQWKFHQKKKELLSGGKELKDIMEPYNKGFNTLGLWNRMRHPNYLGEQGFWVSVYLFTLATGTNHYLFFNPSIYGCLLLILLFLGSSTLAENISKSKYHEYKDYQNTVFKYLPFRKYN